MNDSNKITDKEFWSSYWDNYQYDKIPDKVVFGKYLPKLIEGESFIEIGGFPGTYSAYFYKQGIKDVSFLDFHINFDIVRGFEKKNNLPEGTIKCIETDFFNFNPDRKYDIVFSNGFIEHFEDTRDVINRHVNLLSDTGQLLIIIPNFLGLNGKIQQLYDKDNLDSHNLKSMEIDYLREIMKGFSLQDVTIEYIGKPMVWLEPKPQNRNKRKWVKILSYYIKLFPIKGKALSPFIAIYARK